MSPRLSQMRCYICYIVEKKAGVGKKLECDKRNSNFDTENQLELNRARKVRQARGLVALIETRSFLVKEYFMDHHVFFLSIPHLHTPAFCNQCQKQYPLWRVLIEGFHLMMAIFSAKKKLTPLLHISGVAHCMQRGSKFPIFPEVTVPEEKGAAGS